MFPRNAGFQWALAAVLLAVQWVAAAPTELDRYVAEPDPA